MYVHTHIHTYLPKEQGVLNMIEMILWDAVHEIIKQLAFGDEPANEDKDLLLLLEINFDSLLFHRLCIVALQRSLACDEHTVKAPHGIFAQLLCHFGCNFEYWVDVGHLYAQICHVAKLNFGKVAGLRFGHFTEAGMGAGFLQDLLEGELGSKLLLRFVCRRQCLGLHNRRWLVGCCDLRVPGRLLGEGCVVMCTHGVRMV